MGAALAKEFVRGAKPPGLSAQLDEMNAAVAPGTNALAESAIDLDAAEEEELIEQKNADAGEAKEDSGATIGIIVAVVLLTVGAIAVGLYCKCRASDDEKAEKPHKLSARKEAYKEKPESDLSVEVPSEAAPKQASHVDSLDVTGQKLNDVSPSPDHDRSVLGSFDVLVNPPHDTTDDALGKHKVADEVEKA
jgi:hypothetical protein